MAAAAAAMDLGPFHADGIVVAGQHGMRERRPEAGPAGAALIFGSRGIERKGTPRAVERALAMLLEQGAGEGALGGGMAQDFIGGGGQPLAPLGVRQGDFIWDGGSATDRRPGPG